MKKVLLLLLFLNPVSAFSQNTLTQVLTNIRIHDIAIDSNGKLWTIDSTLKSYNGNVWTSYKEFSASTLQTDERGVLWLIDNNTETFFKFEEEQFIKVTEGPTFDELFKFAVRNGKIWLLAADQAGFHLSYFNGVFWTYYGTINVPSYRIFPFTVDSTGAVLIGTDNGMLRFDGIVWTTVTTENGLLANDVHAIFSDSKGFIWVGTGGYNNGGISRFDGIKWESFARSVYVPDYERPIGPSCFTEDKSGTLWFGYGYGAGKFENNKIIDLRYDKICDFPIIPTTSIAADSTGNIYFGTDQGLYMLKTVITSVEENNPFEIELSNYPNPFNSSTTISYTLPEQSLVSLSIYSITGQQICQYEYGMQSPGAHKFVFNGGDLPSGVYFAQIKADNYLANKRMLLIK